MTKAQYLAALKKLGLTPAEKATAAALGVSVRQCQRYAAGIATIPGPVVKLLRLADRLHLTAEYLAAL